MHEMRVQLECLLNIHIHEHWPRPWRVEAQALVLTCERAFSFTVHCKRYRYGSQESSTLLSLHQSQTVQTQKYRSVIVVRFMNPVANPQPEQSRSYATNKQTNKQQQQNKILKQLKKKKKKKKENSNKEQM